MSGWTASETGLDWTGDQITDLTPDAQIAGIKIQFPTAATTTPRGAAAPRARRTTGRARESRACFCFRRPSFLRQCRNRPAGQPSTAGTAEGGSTSCFSSLPMGSLSLRLDRARGQVKLDRRPIWCKGLRRKEETRLASLSSISDASLPLSPSVRVSPTHFEEGSQVTCMPPSPLLSSSFPLPLAW